MSIDLSLINIWRTWQEFKQGKKRTKEIEHFQYFLEKNLEKLHFDLNNSQYRHGGYQKFTVVDNKSREISVASIRDRITHRLIYNYLTKIYDKGFIFDLWSGRKNKGLIGAIERSQKFLSKYPNSFVWRADIKRFFDHVDREVLTKTLSLKVSDIKVEKILKEIIKSYNIFDSKKTRGARLGCGGRGMPIGNLTSQIFANIYLNELDRFIKHIVRPKPRAYLRYGDDFIIISDNLDELKQNREEVIFFLKKKLRLDINIKNDIIIKSKQGLKFLGVKIFPNGRCLNKRNWNRIKRRLNSQNAISYGGLVRKHSKRKRIKEINWIILDRLNRD